MPQLFLVSNRLPVTVERYRGKLKFVESIGGVATGLDQLHRDRQSTWIGWPGIPRERLTPAERTKLSKEMKRLSRYVPVFLQTEQVHRYYNGFSNSTLWPLFHYFPHYAEFREKNWNMYKEVNAMFAREILRHAREEDTVWIHDFHLFLLPQMLREALPRLTIGFFQHIPFPSYEILRALPWRKDILRGISGADLIGFHTYDDVLHFLKSMERTLGLEHDVGRLMVEDRLVRVDAFPLGIDFEKFVKAAREKNVQTMARNFQRQAGAGRRVILSIDRLDYTKGITERLEAFREFLHRYPRYREKLSLLLVVPPSRTKVHEYHAMKEEIEKLVGNINGSFGAIDWSPVWYISRSLDLTDLASLYVAADIALITPHRDGMNLIAKEYLACRLGGRGVLVLSEMAGAAKELSEAVLVNPSYRESIVQGLLEALRMPQREQQRRNRIMRSSLRRRTLTWWSEKFLTELGNVKALQTTLSSAYVRGRLRGGILQEFRQARKRLFFLDYDGTLSAFRVKPEMAKPTVRLLTLLRKLCESSTVVICTGRKRRDLDRWFKDIPLHFIAEHGSWVKKAGGDWRLLQTHGTGWKASIRDILEQYVDITPGSFIEEKEYTMAWHCRTVDPELREARSRDLLSVLRDMTARESLDVREGKRVIEIRASGIDKGRAAAEWFAKKPSDFILAAGDDWTDEDLFRSLPASAVTIAIGSSPSIARFRLPTHAEFVTFLEECTKTVPSK